MIEMGYTYWGVFWGDSNEPWALFPMKFQAERYLNSMGVNGEVRAVQTVFR
ncbi:MAG: hypothetical protein ACREMO_08640 [Gemmatimonadales bacterium]